jgi:hypothetical protein
LTLLSIAQYDAITIKFPSYVLPRDERLREHVSDPFGTNDPRAGDPEFGLSSDRGSTGGWIGGFPSGEDLPSGSPGEDVWGSSQETPPAFPSDKGPFPTSEDDPPWPNYPTYQGNSYTPSGGIGVGGVVAVIVIIAVIMVIMSL